MRNLVILMLAAIPAGYAQQAPGDPQTLQMLLNEVKQLRQAIERQTLLGTRTQIAISQLQVQETRVAAASKELQGAQDELMRVKEQKSHFTDAIRELEQRRTQVGINPQELQAVDGEIRENKMMLDQFTRTEERTQIRVGELMGQVQAAQRDLQDSRSRIAEMERALDAAIQRMMQGQ